MSKRPRYRHVPFSHSEVACNNNGFVKRLAGATSTELRSGLIGQRDVMAGAFIDHRDTVRMAYCPCLYEADGPIRVVMNQDEISVSPFEVPGAVLKSWPILLPAASITEDTTSTFPTGRVDADLFTDAAFPTGKPTEGITDPHLALVPALALLGFAKEGDFLDDAALGDPDVEAAIESKYGRDALQWYQSYTAALDNGGTLMDKR